MIHYSCDLCQRPIPEDDLRYVVKLEIYAAMDPLDVDAVDDDCDHLLEMHEILERMDASESEEISDDVYKKMRYDLCPECRKKFMKNPLGREVSKQFDFSNN